jgi:MFS family permease
MDNPDAPLVQRATIVLLITQSIASAAFITSTTVNPLVMAKLSGQDALAGVPTALMLAGASLAAYPAGQMMGRLGRRNGLMIGCALGLAGALISGLSAATSTLPLFLIGLLILGAGRVTLDQSRYGAAEINPPERRARALSTVIFGGSIGAILGPALIAPSGDIANRLGLEQLSGPFFTTCVIFVVVALLIFVLLNMDMRAIAMRVAGQSLSIHALAPPTPSPTNNEAKPLTVVDLLRNRLARIALITMFGAQATMVMMMAIISLHMTHHDHDLGDVSLVTSVHVLGMYVFSPFIGQLVDRLGRRTMICSSALVISAGCIIAPLSLMTPWIGLALFFIGLGWSGCYITGSTLLTDAFAIHERARMQGANETMVNIASAIGSLSSGILLQLFGFNILSMIGLCISLLPLLAMLANRPPSPQNEPLPIQ